MQFLFYTAGAVAVVATVLALTRLNAIHALIYLIVSLLAVAIVFFTLGAPFMAALEVIIYAGAIMVLFVFVVMMLNLGPRAEQAERTLMTPGIWIGPTALAIVLIVEVVYLLSLGAPATQPNQVVDPKQVGIALFGPYVIGVELASILLMGGLVGAYHLSWRSVMEQEDRDGIRTDESRAAAGRRVVRAGAGRPADAP